MNEGLGHPDPIQGLTGDIATTVAVFAPRGRDASVASELLGQSGIVTEIVTSLTDLARLIDRHVGVVLLTEEALNGEDADVLNGSIAAQASWSDVPFVVLANGAVRNRSERARESMDSLQNAVLLSRPLHAEELLRAVRSALTARGRQHEARKRMEQLVLHDQQLFESEAKFHAIADSVDQLIWSALPDGTHDYFNNRWYSFTGIPEGELKNPTDEGMFHPDDRSKVIEITAKALKSGDPFELEYRLRYHDGSYRWVLGRAQAVCDKNGQIIRWYGSCTDIHEIKQMEEQRQLMMGEMNHRVKNTLAMVNVMVSQTLRQSDDIPSAQASIQSRLSMMAQAHDRLINAAWEETQIAEVVDAALAPHRTGEGRFDIIGPELPIGSKQALALTMALHELSTNAAKYGALSGEAGQVKIEWGVTNTESQFEFSWTESGGPEVTAPTRKGFGSRMIEKALAGYFDGVAELIYAPEGLLFKLSAPLYGVTDG